MRISAYIIICAVLLAPSPVSAQSIPAHLAGVAAVLYKDAVENLKNQSAMNAAQKQAADATLKALNQMSVKVYGTKPIVINKPIREFEQSLGYGANDPRTPELVKSLWAMPDEKAREKIRDLLKQDQKRVDEAMAALNDARAGGGLPAYSETDLPDGMSVTIQWLSATGEADMTVASDGSGSIPEFSTTFEGEMALGYDETEKNFTLTPKPEDDAPDIATAETLEARRASIIGEWQVEGVGKFIVSAASEDAGNVARSKREIEKEIDDLKMQKENLINQKLYVWKNPKSGREERQEKFSRLNDPWEYRGEIPKEKKLPEILAEIDKKIAALNEEMKGGEPPAVKQDPIGFNKVKAYPQARQLNVAYIKNGNCTLAMDEAWFDGKNLAARTTQKDICSIGAHLPAQIRAKLVSEGWSPPLWLLAKVSSMGENRILTLDFSEHGLHVTYNPDEFTISGIKDPNQTLSGVARREDALHQKYSVASSAVP